MSKDAGPIVVGGRIALAIANANATPTDITGAPNAGQKACVMDLLLSVSVACTLTVREKAGASVTVLSLDVPAGWVGQITLRSYIKATNANQILQVLTSVAAAVKGYSVWHSEI